MPTIVIVSQRQEGVHLLRFVTDILETASHLRSSNGRRRTFLEQLLDCVWAKDKCVCVLEVNVWAERRYCVLRPLCGL